MPYPAIFRPIKNGNYKVSPFQTNKNWSIDQESYSGSGYSLQQATHRRYVTPIGKTTVSTYGNNALSVGTVLDLPTHAGNDPKNQYDQSFQQVIWHSLDHKYYRNAYDPGNNLGASDRSRIEKRLFLSASTITIPYFKVGESVKPGSLKITDTSNGFVLFDDRKGNLRDSLITSQSFASSSNLVGYWGFNEEFRKFKHNYGFHSKDIVFESNAYEVDVKSQVENTGFFPGIKTTGGFASASGIQAVFDGSSYIKTDAYKALNFDKDDDFAISFWYMGNISQSIYTGDSNVLISKRGVNDKLVYSKATRKREVVEEDRTLNRYPFDLEVLNNNAGIENNGKVRFRRSDGVTTYASASATQFTGSQFHIVAQKSGSHLELWVNGTREIQSLDPVPNEVKNFSKLMFGSLNRNLEYALSGSIDEVRIYNYGLNETAIKSLANNHFLSGSAYQTSVAGNIFYKAGQAVISSTMPKYQNALGTGGNDTDALWRLDYKGTHTIYENEVLVEVPQGHCNVSMNPSALQRANTDRLKKDFTGSLTPYITTIGLYNDNAQLLAIGKLAQPIAKRADVDMNFIVRWDY